MDAQAVEECLANSKCGELGERELAKFLLGNQTNDWSAGFVSVAAGILLATQLVIGKDLRVYFKNPGRTGECETFG